MTRRDELQLRPVLLAASAAVAVLGGHLLDAVGLLPGVHESAAVRAAALAPAVTALTVAGAAVLGLGVDALLRSSRRTCALGALVGGQVALLGAPELLGRAEEGDGEAWAALALAVGLQVLLAAAAVATALLLSDRLLRVPVLEVALPCVVSQRLAVVVPYLVQTLLVGGVRGRSPPRPVLP